MSVYLHIASLISAAHDAAGWHDLTAWQMADIRRANLLLAFCNVRLLRAELAETPEVV